MLSSTNVTVEERKVYTTVIGKFDAFFKVCKKVISRFNRRNQLAGESAEQYIVELYRLTKNCNYGALEAEMI